VSVSRNLGPPDPRRDAHQVAHGATPDEILQGYPDLEREDIQQALEYAAWLTREEGRSP
jgi:uncharacterized protein (DUF433 family)